MRMPPNDIEKVLAKPPIMVSAAKLVVITAPPPMTLIDFFRFSELLIILSCSVQTEYASSWNALLIAAGMNERMANYLFQDLNKLDEILKRHKETNIEELKGRILCHSFIHSSRN